MRKVKTVKSKRLRSIRSIALAFFVFLLVFLTWVLANSQDDDVLDAHGFDTIFKAVPEGRNGFSEIQYTQGKDNPLRDAESRNADLKALLIGNTWNQELVDLLLRDNAQYIEDARASITYPHFQLPQGESTLDLPAYSPLVTLLRLLLISAVNEYRNHNYEVAIELLKDAFIFSEKIKTEENNFLISQMVGLSLQQDVLTQIHIASDIEALNTEQLIELQEIVDYIEPIESDGFHRVFEAELLFVSKLFDEQLSQTLAERFEAFQNDQDMYAGGPFLEEEHKTLPRLIYRMGNVLFPKFYLHKNTSLSRVAKYYTQFSEAAKGYCTFQPNMDTEYDWGIPISWADVITPNSAGVNDASNMANFDPYIVRRCYGSLYAEAVKTIVAIKRYRKENGVLPNELAELVPAYMRALPIDSFTGKPLLYSSTNQWLYAFGINHTNNQGSTKTLFHSDCRVDEECLSNPTFPIFSEIREHDSD